MKLKSVGDLDVKGKTVLLRSDLNLDCYCKNEGDKNGSRIARITQILK